MNKRLSNKAKEICNKFDFQENKAGLFYSLRMYNNGLYDYIQMKFHENINLLDEEWILKNLTITELENCIK